VHVALGSFLDKLDHETKSVSKETGLDQAALVTYVLTGLKPLLPRARVTWGERSAHPYMTVTFNAADLTDKEQRALYSEVRGYLRSKGKITLEDWEFWQLVEEMGGPPTKHGEKRRFWEEVRRRWNSEHKGEGYTHYNTWEGVKTRYWRLSERL
jgi:hypothetical protein